MTGGVRSGVGVGESATGLSPSEMFEGMGAAIAHRVVFALVRVRGVIVGVDRYDGIDAVAAHSVLMPRF